MAAQKILVVDDEARMRKLVADFLAKEGFEVLEAEDGEKAMDLFYAEKDIALVILDVMMPKNGRLAGPARDTRILPGTGDHADCPVG